MEHFLRRTDLLVLIIIFSLAIAMSNILTRFTLSKTDLSSQTENLIPYEITKGKDSLQFNSINFKPQEKSGIIFKCPIKNTPQPPEPNLTPVATCPPVTCQSCDPTIGGCGRTWENTSCHPCTITDCATQCPSHPPPPTSIPVTIGPNPQ